MRIVFFNVVLSRPPGGAFTAFISTQSVHQHCEGTFLFLSSGPREMSAGDRLQHSADQTETQQQACLHAIRRTHGVRMYSDSDLMAVLIYITSPTQAEQRVPVHSSTMKV